RVNQQGQVLEDIRTLTGESVAAQRLALDGLLAGASVTKPGEFQARYEQLTRELEQSKKDVVRWQTRETLAVDQARALALSTAALKKELDEAKKIVARYKEEIKESPDLLSQLNKLRDESAEKSEKIRGLEELYDVATDKEKAAQLVRRYERAWYFAVA